MKSISDIFSSAIPYLTPVAVVVLFILLSQLFRYILARASKRSGDESRGFRAQLAQLGLGVAGVLIFLLVLPVGDTLRGQLVSLFGILLSMAVAISSTTFVGNVMAGLMLKSVRNFRSGDFIQVENRFGRVSRRSLLFTEIQTEDRDLVTLPNLFLVTNPVRVLRSSGTIVSATVSLGYDVQRGVVEKILLAAATEAELSDPFVQIMDLGDFSVTYRIAGLLDDPRYVLTARSRLRGLMMDQLHHGAVEIVSPAFMNQRVYDNHREFIPKARSAGIAGEPIDDVPEDLLFDKADKAASIEQLKRSLEESEAQGQELKEEMKNADESGRLVIKNKEEMLERRKKQLEELLALRLKQLEKSED